MKLRKVLSLFVALVMMVQVLPLSLFANEEAEMVEEISQSIETVSAGTTETVYVDSSSLADNDELLEGYIEQLFGISDNSGIMLAATYTGEDALSGVNLDVYQQLKTAVASIASGATSSTVITLSVDCNCSDLGVANITDQESLNTAFTAFYESLDLSLIVDYLLNDCPYEMYWFDKTAGVGDGSVGVSDYSAEGFTAYLILPFYVATAYQGADSTTVDSSKVAAAQTAVAYAKSIVEGYAGTGCSDLVMVTDFKKLICNLVSYEYDNDVDYGDIWQLVYVFDKDTSTNVVCEGYSKAFQYLCDLAGIDCITVTGTMSGGTGEGAHMWNIVYIDGVNYLVDVTNSDTGSVGQDGGLFMVCADDADESSATGYTFTVNNQTITYAYDAETLAMYPEDYLILGETDAVGTHKVSVYADCTYEVVASAKAGKEVTITFAPDDPTDKVYLAIDSVIDYDSEGYSNWWEEIYSGMFSGSSSYTYTFTMPDYDVEIFLMVGQYTFTNVTNNPDAGTAEAGDILADAGETVEVYVQVFDGYVLSSLTITDASGNSIEYSFVETYVFEGYYNGKNYYEVYDIYEFTMPASDVTITGVFAEESAVTKYDITVSNDNHCTADVVSSAAEGETVTITLTPDTGYNYAWLYIQTVTGYDNEGTAVEFGVLDEILLDSTSGWTYTFTMPANELIIYVFDGQYTVTTTTEKSEAGGVTLSTPIAEEGENYSFMAYVYDGYTLSDVSVVDANNNEIEITLDEDYPYSDGSTTSYMYTFTMPASDVTISAVFEEIPTYSVTLSSTITNGTASVDKTSAAEGETVTITVTPDAGYEVYLNITSATTYLPYTYTDNGDGTYSFIMPADDVNVNIGIGKYYISSDWDWTYGNLIWYVSYWDDESSIYVSKSGIYDEGDIVTVNVSVGLDYLSVYDVSGLKVIDASGNEVEATLVTTGTATWLDANGNSLGEGPYYSYQFTMPASDVTISAVLEEISTTGDYTITVDADDGCTYDIVSSANEGDTVTLTITPTGDNKIIDLWIFEITQYDSNGNVTGMSNFDYQRFEGEASYTYTFTMPGADLDFNFVVGQYKLTWYTEGYTEGDGRVATSVSLADEGDIVEVNVRFYGDCELSSLTAVDSNNNPVTLTLKESTVYDDAYVNGEKVDTMTIQVYELTMPAGDVAITGLFAKSHTHTLVKTEAKDATCDTDGNIEYWYCAECDSYFSDEDGTTEITLAETVAPATGHTEDEAVIENEVAATCTVDGFYDTVVYCKTCGEELSRVTTTVPATGHTLGEPEFTWNWSETEQTYTATAKFTCTVCGETETQTALVTSVKTAATCTDTGSIVYTATVDMGGTPYTETKTVELPITSHTEGEAVTENVVEATCTTDGSYDSVIYCSVCGEEISHETITVPATGHDYELTYTDPDTGDKTYVCSVCGDTLVIKGTGTLTIGCTTYEVGYSEDMLFFTSGNWSSYKLDGGSSFLQTLAQEGAVLAITRSAPSGVTSHSSTTYEKFVLSDSWYSLNPYLQLGTAGTTSADEPTQGIIDCISDDGLTVLYDAEEVYAAYVAAGGLTGGDPMIVSNTSADGVYKITNITVYLPDTVIHTWGEGVVTTEATCTEDGVKTYTCTVCGETKTETIPATGHSTEIQNAVDATCTTDGYTGDEVCTICGETVTSGEIIPATGHTYGEPVFTWITNNTAIATVTCSVCGDEQELTCTVTSKTTSSTCSADGEIVYTATVEFNGTTYTDTNTVVLNATGHNFGSETAEFNITVPAYVLYGYATAGESFEITLPSSLSDDVTLPVTYLLTVNGATVTLKGSDGTGSGTYTQTVEVGTFGRDYSEIAGANAMIPQSLAVSATDDIIITAIVDCSAYASDQTIAASAVDGVSVTYIDVSGGTATVTTSDMTITKTYEGADITWAWSEDNSSATATFKCLNDSNHTEVVAATITSSTTDATCDEAGETVYTATATLDGITYTTTKTVAIDATGHTWGEPEFTWNWSETEQTYTVTAKFTCTVCDETETQPALVTSVKTAATCTAAGSIVYTATVDMDSTPYTETKTVELPIIPHTEGNPVTENSVAATCTTDGSYDTVVYCSTCGAELSRETTVVPAFGHTEGESVIENNVAATCTTDGSYDTVTYCTTCGEELSRTTTTVPAFGHKYGEPTFTWAEDYTAATATFVCENDETHVLEVEAEVTSATTAATCEADGSTVYTATVTLGDNTYTDEKTDAVTEALGHSYKLTSWTWAADYSSATALFTCEHDSTHVEEVTASLTSEETAATETSYGKTTYTATVTFDGVTYTSTQVDLDDSVVMDEECNVYDVEVENVGTKIDTSNNEATIAIQAGDTYIEINYDTNTDTEISVTITTGGVSYEFKITVSSSKKSSMIAVADIVAEAEAEGTILDLNSFESLTITSTSATVGTVNLVSSTGNSEHSYYVVDRDEPSCTEPGTIYYECSTCGDTHTEPIPATGHTEGESVIENRVEATRTTAGSYDLVTYCSVCGAEISRETVVIPATGVDMTTIWLRTPANYSALNEVIARASALNPDDYTNFDTVTEAINAVNWNLNVLSQSTVDGYVKAIENAIAGLIPTGLTVEEIEIEEPIEDTNSDSEPDDEPETLEVSDPEPDSNPTTGIALSLLPMALAALAATVGKRR
ncbi:MAG: hypothetical protein LUG49_04810 [Oscillospiraceae bacterium]|nr:hypothetical protein [Oscillospiraceae bacterium]